MIPRRGGSSACAASVVSQILLSRCRPAPSLRRRVAWSQRSSSAAAAAAPPLPRVGRPARRTAPPPTFASASPPDGRRRLTTGTAGPPKVGNEDDDMMKRLEEMEARIHSLDVAPPEKDALLDRLAAEVVDVRRRLDAAAAANRNLERTRGRVGGAPLPTLPPPRPTPFTTPLATPTTPPPATTMPAPAARTAAPPVFGRVPDSDSVHHFVRTIVKDRPPGSLTSADVRRAKTLLFSSSKWGGKKGADVAERLLERLRVEHTEGRCADAAVTTEMYNVAIDAWAKSGPGGGKTAEKTAHDPFAGGSEIAKRVGDMARRMEERHRAEGEARRMGGESGGRGRGGGLGRIDVDVHAARPDRVTYNTLLHAYAKSIPSISSSDEAQSVIDRAEAVVAKMNALADEAFAYSSSAPPSSNVVDDDDYGTQIRPDGNTYTALMNVHASRKNGGRRSAERAEEVLLLVSELAAGGGGGGSREKQRGAAATDERGGRAPTPPAPPPRVHLDGRSFNIAIKAWANAGLGLAGALRAESLVRTMVRLSAEGDHGNVRPTPETFLSAFDAFSKVGRGDGPEAAMRVDALLDVLESAWNEAGEDGDVGGIVERGSGTSRGPTTACYNAAVNAYAKSGVPDAGERARALIDRMRSDHSGASRPDEITVASVVEAYARGGAEGSIRRALEFLTDASNNDSGLPRPNAVAFNSLLDGIAKGRDKDEDDESGKFDRFDEVMQMMKNLGGEALPDGTTYRIVIGACSRECSSPPGGGRRPRRTGVAERKAVDYLRDMLQSSHGVGGGGGMDKNARARPNSYVFNACLAMLAGSNDSWTVHAAHQTLLAMQRQSDGGNEDVVPDTIAYNMTIGKLAKAGTKKSADQAERLLRNMEERAASGNANVVPDVITYTCAVRAQIYGGNPRRASEIAASVLCDGDGAAATATKATTTAAAPGGGAADGREETTAVADGRGNGAGLALDGYGFRVLLSALAQGGGADAARAAWEARERTDDEEHRRRSRGGSGSEGECEGEGGPGDLFLTPQLCDLIVLAHTHPTAPPPEVDRHRRRRRDEDGNAGSNPYAFVMTRIDRFENSGGGGGEKDAILPTAVGFSAALGYLARAGQIDDAFRLLAKIKDLRGGGIGHRRDVVNGGEGGRGGASSQPRSRVDPKTVDYAGCYAALLGGLAKNGGSSSNAAHALEVLKLAIDDLGKSKTSESESSTSVSAAAAAIDDVRIWNAALGACASTEGKLVNRRRALDVAFRIFHLFVGDGSSSFSSCDAITYGTMVKACMNLVDDDKTRKSRLKPIIESAAKNGLVGNMVWTELGHLRKELTGEEKLSMLPREWRGRALILDGSSGRKSN